MSLWKVMFSDGSVMDLDEDMVEFLAARGAAVPEQDRPRASVTLDAEEQVSVSVADQDDSSGMSRFAELVFPDDADVQLAMHVSWGLVDVVRLLVEAEAVSEPSC